MVNVYSVIMRLNMHFYFHLQRREFALFSTLRSKKIFLLRGIVICCCLSALPGIRRQVWATPVRPPNPVSAWLFDEGSNTTAFDSIGNNDGILSNMIANPWNSTIRHFTYPSNYSLAFEPDDDLVNFGSDASLDNLSNYTFFAWIYPTNWGENSDGDILSKGDQGPELRLKNEGSVTQGLRGWVDSSSFSAANSTNNTITLDQWQMVAFTFSFDGDGVPRLYRDSNELAYSLQLTNTGTRDDDSIKDLIAGDATGTRAYGGYIDELAV